MGNLTTQIKSLAYAAGFELVGVAPAGRLPHASYLRDWLDRGWGGDMTYLKRNIEERIDPTKLLPQARSVICLGMNYHQGDFPTPYKDGESPAVGRVARYAWGKDYHKIIKKKLTKLQRQIEAIVGRSIAAKACVDSVPLLEKELATRAGIGWMGKNTCVINESMGSYFFLAELITELDLEFDGLALDRCGNCTACIDACPTQAIEPYQLNASRCISYFTIELRGDIPEEFHRQIGDWAFGCDICQEVCPWNRKAPSLVDEKLAMLPGSPFVDLVELVQMRQQEYQVRFAGRALKRARLEGLQRNAIVVMANAREGPK